MGVVAVVAAIAAAAAAQEAARDITAEGMRAERRVALVVGNGAYPRERLRNPGNDARAMAEALRALGFDVLVHQDLTEKEMRRAIDAFGERLRGSGVGLFYYSGHGVQVKGRNYVVPVDAKIDAESEVEYEAVDVGRVLAKMEAVRNRLNIVVLDACRNNPFERAWRSTGGGLAQMLAPSGTFIAYATAPGRTASDGTGANGLYTSQLLESMRQPGLTLEEVFKRAGQAVRDRTSGAQEPWFASSVYGTFMFALPKSGQTPRAGSIALTARLDGIEVWLGNRKVGDTRTGEALVVAGLTPGSHRVTARRPGYREWERDVVVIVGQRVEVDIKLEALGPAKVIKGDDGAEMVLVPAGEFWMGSSGAETARVIDECKRLGNAEDRCKDWHEREAPRHRVRLDDYYVDRHEVTNAQFERFVTATGHRTTAEREGSGWARQQKDGKWQWAKVDGAEWRKPNGPGSSSQPSHPVAQVSWHDAEAYCRWAGKRLPTEAEWEKAARGTDGRRYPWGDAWDQAKATGWKTDRLEPVGTYPQGVSPYGAHDMAGNVWEWVADWFDKDYYKQSPERRNPTGPATGQFRVLRGGSWNNNPFVLRAAIRNYNSPVNRFNYFGFRCARGLP